jgi:hypothetical protein
LRGEVPELSEALDGMLAHAHVRLVAQMLYRLERVEQPPAELDELIAEPCGEGRISDGETGGTRP